MKIRAVLAAAFIYAILAAPDYASLQSAMMRPLAIEFPALLVLLMLTPGWTRGAVRSVLTVTLLVVVLTKLANSAMQFAAGRPFDLVLDLHLVEPVWNMATGTYGVAIALLLAPILALAIAATALLIWLSLDILARQVLAFGTAGRALVAGALMLFAAAFVLDVGGTANASSALASQVVRARESAIDLRNFAAETASDPAPVVAADQLLHGLRGKDVFFVFVESYGASLLTRQDYRARTEAALQKFGNVLTKRKWSAHSAFLDSTTTGGQSWLAHSSLMSGLRIDSQRRYEKLVAGRRTTLISDFGSAGWNTAAVMPAITKPWADARFFGFDNVIDFHALSYRGKSFDWVAMPDQFTLARLQNLRGARPLMAEIALLSSHFPWAPLPKFVPWDKIGDGTIYNAQVENGQKPDAVWQDMSHVRNNYLASIEYVLEVLASYVETYGDDRLVMIVLGDHPPISIVAGDDRRHVPVHILSGDPQILEAIREWNWTEGMIPVQGAPVWPMQDFRAKFLAAFSAPRPD